MARRKKTRARDAARADAADAADVGTKNAPRTDGYYNNVSDIGTWRDPSRYTAYVANVLSNEEARELWTGNDVAAKIVELRPKHAFRKGVRLQMADKGLGEKIMSELESIPCGDERGISTAFRQAGYFENAYGGAAIFPVINDGADLSTPLRTGGRMRRIENFLVLEPRELTPASWYRSLLEPKFGRPRTYRLNAFSNGGMHKSNQVIHESRLIIFPGIVVARDQVSTNYGWGHGKLNRSTEALEQFGITWGGVAALMHRIEQGVLKMEGFGDMMRDDEDKTVANALLHMDRFRSLIKMLVIDKDDDYQRLGVPLTGVPDVLQQFMLRLAGSAEIPATFLFGMAPAGMNATGESDAQWFDDSVAVEQNDHFKPRVEQAVRLHMLCNESVTRGQEPDVWSVDFPPLRQLSEKEEAERNNTQADADVKYIDAGVLTPAIVRRNRFAGDTYTTQTTVSDKEMRELEALEKAGEEEDPDEGDPTEDPRDPREQRAAPSVAVSSAPMTPETQEPADDPGAKDEEKTDAIEAPDGRWYAVRGKKIVGGPYTLEEIEGAGESREG